MGRRNQTGRGQGWFRPKKYQPAHVRLIIVAIDASSIYTVSTVFIRFSALAFFRRHIAFIEVPISQQGFKGSPFQHEKLAN